MAIEPLGSIMSLQQSQTVHKTETEVRHSAGENTEVLTAEKPNNVDGTTAVVSETQSKGENTQNGSTDQFEQNQDKIRKAVEQMNKNLNNSEAIFGIHEATNRVTIKIVDKDTKKVIKELPPEKTLDMIAKAWEMAGILVDERR